jgi:hypothetical protein
LRLTGKQDQAEKDLSDLRRQYEAAGKRETMDQLSADIVRQGTTVEEAKRDREQRFQLVQSGGGHPPILGKDVFLSIPHAMGITEVKESYIELPFFIALFFGMQRAIVIFATNRRKETKPKEVKRPIDRFEDVTDAEYIEAANLPDGSVKAPEDLASDLGISLNESYRKHTSLFAEFAYENGKYVRNFVLHFRQSVFHPVTPPISDCSLALSKSKRFS